MFSGEKEGFAAFFMTDINFYVCHKLIFACNICLRLDFVIEVWRRVTKINDNIMNLVEHIMRKGGCKLNRHNLHNMKKSSSTKILQ